MKKTFCAILCASIIFAGCGNKNTSPDTDIDVARRFIRDIQESNFKDASNYLLKDETNLQYFERFEEHYRSRPADELEQYKNADIIINEIAPVNDSVTVINYSNSFKQAEKNKVKVVRTGGKWLIDLKYTFSGNL